MAGMEFFDNDYSFQDWLHTDFSGVPSEQMEEFVTKTVDLIMQTESIPAIRTSVPYSVYSTAVMDAENVVKALAANENKTKSSQMSKWFKKFSPFTRKEAQTPIDAVCENLRTLADMVSQPIQIEDHPVDTMDGMVTELANTFGLDSEKLLQVYNDTLVNMVITDYQAPDVEARPVSQEALDAVETILEKRHDDVNWQKVDEEALRTCLTACFAKNESISKVQIDMEDLYLDSFMRDPTLGEEELLSMMAKHYGVENETLKRKAQNTDTEQQDEEIEENIYPEEYIPEPATPERQDAPAVVQIGEEGCDFETNENENDDSVIDNWIAKKHEYYQSLKNIKNYHFDDMQEGFYAEFNGASIHYTTKNKVSVSKGADILVFNTILDDPANAGKAIGISEQASPEFKAKLYAACILKGAQIAEPRPNINPELIAQMDLSDDEKAQILATLQPQPQAREENQPQAREENQPQVEEENAANPESSTTPKEDKPDTEKKPEETAENAAFKERIGSNSLTPNSENFFIARIEALDKMREKFEKMLKDGKISIETKDGKNVIVGKNPNDVDEANKILSTSLSIIKTDLQRNAAGNIKLDARQQANNNALRAVQYSFLKNLRAK